jgi:diguanylate cyclase (GGDEF)-like protein
MSERKPAAPEQPPSGHHEKTFIAHAPGPAERSRAILSVATGPDAGRVLPIARGQTISFGRADTCTYSWPDGSLSRVHAVIAHVAGAYVIKDEGSTNGTFINDRRLDRTARLEDGDRIQLGMYLMMRFSLVTPEEEASMMRLYEAAMRDGLTGVFNRKHIEERLEAEIAFAARHGTPLSIAMLDVDHFKRVNDTYGHPAGDAVLRNVAGTLARGLRTEDVVGRYGGEEFIVVARGINVQEGAQMAERLRYAIAQAPTTFEGTTIPVSASFGVASLRCCGERREKAALISLADARLYQAKEQGRNRVVAG